MIEIVQLEQHLNYFMKKSQYTAVSITRKGETYTVVCCNVYTNEKSLRLQFIDFPPEIVIEIKCMIK